MSEEKERQVYWTLASQPARAVRTLINIGKIPATFTNVNLAKAEHLDPKYVALHPVPKVPLLKEGDWVLGESSAIMVYLCEIYPHLAQYHGTTPEARARVNRWMGWYHNYFRPFVVAPVRTYLHAYFRQTPVSPKQQRTLDQGIKGALDQLEELLKHGQTRFMGGESPSIADFLFFYELTNLIYFDLALTKHPRVQQWFDEVYAIPEVKEITHQWYQVAKVMKRNFKEVEVATPKL